MQPHIERIDVSTEELEGLLEQARPMLSEDGYQKLRAAIRTLSYVTELLETRETTLERLRRLLCHVEHGEDREGAEAGRHRDGREEGRKAPERTAHPEKCAPWAWAQWR